MTGALVACGGSEEATGTATATEPPATEETGAGGGELAASPVVGVLDQGYRIDEGGDPALFEASEFPVEPGSVEAHWYQAGGRYVVVYAGLSLEEAGPLCPGNSIQTASGFEHVSNSPTAEGACEGAQALAGADAGARACGPLLLYVTEIPTDAEGTLYGTIERFEADGGLAGLTSVTTADGTAAPEIDPEADSYSVPAGFLPDGATEVTC